MSDFPKTTLGGLSLARMVIGTNWFLGYSHTSKAKDTQINETMTATRIADILEVFLNAGVNCMLGMVRVQKMIDAIADAEDRTGRKLITMSIPTLNVGEGSAADDDNRRILDDLKSLGVSIVMPHQATTDALLDRRTRTIRGAEAILKMIREREMVPGLSTHMPETIIYADESELDVETYIQIYNAAGFLMQVEVDWIHRVITNAKKPVVTIKPLAAGRLLPLVGLAFSWATLRDQDMVAVGTMTPDEAREVIDISLSILERRSSNVELQRTRSKGSLEKK